MLQSNVVRDHIVLLVVSMKNGTTTVSSYLVCNFTHPHKTMIWLSCMAVSYLNCAYFVKT